MRQRAAVFLITFSGLVFEIGLTRIYSATIWYHFAFVAISVALLGWGLGGMCVHLLKKPMPSSTERAALFSMLYAIAIPAALWVLVQFPFETSRLSLYFLTPLVPFLLAGMALSMVFDLNRAESGSLYFADLLGASLGALAVTVFLQRLGGEATLLLSAVAPMIAAAYLSKPLRTAATLGAVVLAVAAFTNSTTELFRVVPGTIKAMRKDLDAYPGSKVTQEGWNAYSRISAVEGIPPPYLARLYIDSDAWTSIYPWDGQIEHATELRDSYRALPFKLTPKGETMVIGPGGGSDVLAALASGQRKVTAVELNPLMIQFVRHYGEKAGNIYSRPDVEVIQSEGRNFVSRTDRKFDVIFLGFVDSWASVASGGLSLSENYLYTAQAFKDYYDHLTDDGVLVILRWDLDVPRLVSNAVAVLGVEEASKRIAVLMEKRGDARAAVDPSQMLFMLRKRAFNAGEIATIKNDWTLARPMILPGEAPAPYDALLSGQNTMAQYTAESAALVGPVFDDSPFYFATERPWGMPPGIANRLFTWLLAPAVGLLLLFAGLGKPAGAPVSPYLGSVVYFSALGFGFISVELALLQHLTLLVGHPIFTLSVLLFTLLAFGGVGSSLTGRISARAACLGVAIIGIIEAFVLPNVVPSLLALSLPMRVVVAMIFIAPLGVLMGIPFPSGLRKTGQGSLPAPPFYWGLNGILSVIGSVTTVFIALLFGFQVAMIVGATCYLIAAGT
ncbi:MAG: methyltransferase domain-containing protein, partial [Acidobacteria bacterium]|nr:methyltransferase domain-containing protein [Acidobacteriota bacterium]